MDLIGVGCHPIALPELGTELELPVSGHNVDLIED
jgi:hypothetical protein